MALGYIADQLFGALFDWFVGSAVDSVAAANLREKLQSEAERWARALPPHLQLSTAAPLLSSARDRSLKASGALTTKLQDQEAPTVEDWFACLRDRWNLVREELEDRNEELAAFLTLPPDEVEPHLRDLARRLATVCEEDTVLFQVTTLRLVRANQECLEQIKALVAHEERAAGATVEETFPQSSVRAVYVIGGVTGETDYNRHERLELQDLCLQLGRVICEGGAELIVCSPFEDSADAAAVLGYVRAGGSRVTFHLPTHDSVEQAFGELQNLLGEHRTSIAKWKWPGPDDEASGWGPAWALCQIQALDYADVVVAVGGRVDKTASMLLHLAEARRLPVLPLPHMGGAAGRSYERHDWGLLYPWLDPSVLTDRKRLGEVMTAARGLVAARVASLGRDAVGFTRFFVSRASKDATEFSAALVEAIKADGLVPVLGDDTVTGNRMPQASIDDAIVTADVVIVLWSRGYALSPWCNDELELALSRLEAGQSRVWIFRLDDCEVVPRRARSLPAIPADSPAALVDAFRLVRRQLAVALESATDRV